MKEFTFKVLAERSFWAYVRAKTEKEAIEKVKNWEIDNEQTDTELITIIETPKGREIIVN